MAPRGIGGGGLQLAPPPLGLPPGFVAPPPPTLLGLPPGFTPPTAAMGLPPGFAPPLQAATTPGGLVPPTMAAGGMLNPQLAGFPGVMSGGVLSSAPTTAAATAAAPTSEVLIYDNPLVQMVRTLCLLCVATQ